ncbi:MAG TPA: hypothetical protein VLT36_05920 [Candidatus Dormibacteraeota bacterium]|nr:hypothetical protein [Candidatus Dormibacteraeota bacterium]
MIETANLDSPSAWNSHSAPAVVIGGQYIVTNPITRSQQFYRLVH